MQNCGAQGHGCRSRDVQHHLALTGRPTPCSLMTRSGLIHADGWRLRRSLPWRGRGDIDSLAIGPMGVAFVVETKTRTHDDRHLARVREQAAWLSRRRRRWCRCGAVPVVCLVRPRGVQRLEQDVLVLSIDSASASAAKRRLRTRLSRPRAWNARTIRRAGAARWRRCVGSPVRGTPGLSSPSCRALPVRAAKRAETCSRKQRVSGWVSRHRVVHARVRGIAGLRARQPRPQPAEDAESLAAGDEQDGWDFGVILLLRLWRVVTLVTANPLLSVPTRSSGTPRISSRGCVGGWRGVKDLRLRRRRRTSDLARGCR
jgi:hypothetical protein